MVVAARGVQPFEADELDRRIADVEQRLGLPASGWLRLIRPLSAFDKE